MITVIATGFEAARRGGSLRREAATEPGYSVRRTRDFLSELESERSAVGTGMEPVPAPSSSMGQGADEVGEPVMVPKRPAPYEADDLEIPSFLRRK